MTAAASKSRIVDWRELTAAPNCPFLVPRKTSSERANERHRDSDLIKCGAAADPNRIFAQSGWAVLRRSTENNVNLRSTGYGAVNNANLQKFRRVMRGLAPEMCKGSQQVEPEELNADLVQQISDFGMDPLRLIARLLPNSVAITTVEGI